MINCILAGVGGQGTVLASKLIAQTAINQGQKARTAETIGMAQRGGCVVSHVRIGEDIHSPLVPLKSADLIIGFEPAEAVRSLAYLKANGIVVVSQKAIKPITAALSDSDYDGSEMLNYLRSQVSRLFVVDTEAICAACGSTKVSNIALLGVAVATGALGFSLADVEHTIGGKLPTRFVDMNLQALHAGASSVLEEALS